MNNANGLFIALFLFVLGQSLIWIQTNGQFVWKWVNDHPLLMSIGLGVPISYIFIKATRFTVDYFDGMLWPSRFIGFAIGIVCFALMTYLFKGEGITTKTFICLLLAFSLISIQIFWK